MAHTHPDAAFADMSIIVTYHLVQLPHTHACLTCQNTVFSLIVSYCTVLQYTSLLVPCAAVQPLQGQLWATALATACDRPILSYDCHCQAMQLTTTMQLPQLLPTQQPHNRPPRHLSVYVEPRSSLQSGNCHNCCQANNNPRHHHASSSGPNSPLACRGCCCSPHTGSTGQQAWASAGRVCL